MAPPLVDRLLARAGRLDRPADGVAGIVEGFYRVLGPLGRPLQSFLNGTWTGHPLHPLLTDVPIGAWTVVLVLDLWGIISPESATGGAGAIALWFGVLAALGAAVSGLTDWKDTFGYERRVGFVHMLVMLAATALYVVSGVLRLSAGDEAASGRIVGLAGYVLLVAGGYFGGEMAFGFGSMVNHNAFREGPGKFTPVGVLADVGPGTTYVEAKGVPVLLVRDGAAITAIGAICSHAGGPLRRSAIENGCLTCPWHGSRFHVADGSVARGPATFQLPRYEVRVTDEGQVEVRRAGP